MSASRERRAARDARAAAADGTALRWPGAANKFALFAEVLFTGVLVTVLALPLVTLPLALAVGARHLRRFVLDEPSSMRTALAEARAGLLRSLPVGLGLVVASAALALDLALVAGGALPGAAAVGVVCAALLAAGLVVLLTACAAWQPDSRWLPLLQEAAARSVRDLRGSGAVLVALLLAAVVTWQLAPLVVPALGCTVFAAVAVRFSRTAVE
ncbi:MULTISPECIES: hypothetical protein [unclassified Rathayibacter]|uniref:hypothetical protein n=1 Tax=unclassified Rathayibacter TaxID=2609250 RepID=UPI0006F9EBAE|nr:MULTISPECIES: hypothetical protein [unclassified Rathayibacter]KQQ05545.1 hypothetical protein ASF42_02940 [Rathayibacter sp. Leaf294]KQS13408.1 hypothetical protein ASG06_02955 [Rathayibacter sp. Leaf185]